MCSNKLIVSSCKCHFKGNTNKLLEHFLNSTLQKAQLDKNSSFFISINHKQKQHYWYAAFQGYRFKINYFRLNWEAKTLPNWSLHCFYDFAIIYFTGIYFHVLYSIFCDSHRVRSEKMSTDMSKVLYKCLRNHLNGEQ